MDSLLIAAGWLDPWFWLGVLKVAVGLGMVIFVHELGHFAVAKMCGVKCEKFYVGFDIAGLKLCKFKWGETEYGIGILPLGGYVKMLGQEDNPARLKEEIERAKMAEADEEAPENGGGGTTDAVEAKEDGATTEADTPVPEAGESEVDLEAAKAALYDPRSYLAQNVYKRFAIISAGVVMNMIFAFIVAVIAFMVGVKQSPCVVGSLVPGAPAWQADMRVGDQIIEINGRRIGKFRDMQEAVTLGDHAEKGATIVFRRPGEAEPRRVLIAPDRSGLAPQLGIGSSVDNVLWSKADEPAVREHSPAAASKPPFQHGDRIVGVDGHEVNSYAGLHRYLAAAAEDSVVFTVERVAKQGQTPERLDIKVEANPMRRIGLVMEMGQITAVQAGSPAEAVGLQPGDKIVTIDGEDPVDPMVLPQWLGRRAGETIELAIEREGLSEGEPLKVQITPRQVTTYSLPMMEDQPVVASALGIAYRVLNRVHEVIEDSPAAKAGLHPGAVIRHAKTLPPESDSAHEFELSFGEEERNWPFFMRVLQTGSPKTRVELQWGDEDNPKKATMATQAANDAFSPLRGLELEGLSITEQAETIGEAVRLGANETIGATMMVFRFLKKLGQQQVSPKAMGGPGTIFAMAKRDADEGMGRLLIFLTLISANLAVINFLPIPLLDGGHAALLVTEWVRGKPPEEKVQLVLTYMGLVFVLSLMLWVIGLDIVRWLLPLV